MKEKKLHLIGDAYKLGVDLPKGLTLLRKKYGKIFGFWLGKDRAVAISDFEVLQDILNKNETAFRQQSIDQDVVKMIRLEILSFWLQMFLGQKDTTSA